ncbi:MAG: TonB C-terminal domain-containing protein [Candidatus Aceula lacicola]|nr:TonB C-terminal domain-containing protein [Candidatus Aceula lacicola]
MEDKIFKYAIAISLIIHIGILARMSYSNIHFQTNPINRIEVVYPKMTVQNKVVAQEDQRTRDMKINLEKTTQELTEQKLNLSSFMKDMTKLADDLIHRNVKPKIVRSDKAKRKVSVPEIEPKRIKNPLYTKYYQDIRSRIREKAYQNYEQFDAGEVYVTFIIEDDGGLKDIKIIEERTNANQYLRRISIRSVEQASPFPPFPEGLKYPELSFNVVISFEVE